MNTHCLFSNDLFYAKCAWQKEAMKQVPEAAADPFDDALEDGSLVLWWASLDRESD
jgi:hypothetical protein